MPDEPEVQKPAEPPPAAPPEKPEKAEKVEEVIEPQTPPTDPATHGLDDVLAWKERRDRDLDDLMKWRTDLTAEREAEKAEHRKTVDGKTKKENAHGVQEQKEKAGGSDGETKHHAGRLRLFHRHERKS